MTDEGNFEHGLTHLSLLGQEELDWRVKEDPVLKSASRKLFEIREKRIHPLSTCCLILGPLLTHQIYIIEDDKQLTHWNGLMIRAMSFAARVLQDVKYLHSAQRGMKSYFIGYGLRCHAYVLL